MFKNVKLKEKALGFYGRYKAEICSAIAGMIIFILVYGYRLLNPMNISWMYHGLSSDFTQHYLGWRGFRNSAWTFPIGLMDQLTYPDKVSIIYTDSIPLFAIFFKILSPILPNSFQYFGLWGIMTYALNGIVAAKILKRYLNSLLNIVLGSLFFMLSFQMVERMYYHSALAAHWMLLIPIYFILIRREMPLKDKAVAWGIIGVLCPLVHSYFILFDGIILVGFIIGIILDKNGMEKDMKARLLTSCAVLMAFVASGLLMLYVLGAFHNSIADLSGNVENYGLDLNAFFNEMRAGYFPEYLPYRKGHRIYYLGAGMLILTACTLIRIIKKKELSFFRERKNTFIALTATYIIALLVACSPLITLNGQTVIHYSLPDFIMNIWSVFRNTARTSWVCIYLIFIFAICADSFVKADREKKTAILIFAFMIQFLDMSPYIIERHGKIIAETNVKEFDPHLGTSYLDTLIADHGIKHIVFGPIYDYDFKYLTGYAMSRHLTTNVFRLAQGSRRNNEEVFRTELYNPDGESLYIIRAEDSAYAYDDCGINWLDTGEFIIGIVGEW